MKSTEKKKNPYLLSFKESRAIIKSNMKAMKTYEKRKRAKVLPEQYTTVMKNADNVLEIEDLHTYFFTDNGVVKSVNGVSLEVPRDKIVGIVGESGCGKSVTSLSVMQLVQAPQGQITGGEIRFNNDTLGYDEKGNHKCYDIVKMPTSAMYGIRGKDISMIFQEPMTSLNPVFTIGKQLDEVILLHGENMDKEKAKAHSINMLSLVGIPMPEKIYGYYPHQLSGGMRQRVMIAMALSGSPKLIIADEPTTALDVTIQSQILDLLKKVQRQSHAAVMLITHDLGVVAEMADYVVVMYAGKIVEKGTVFDIFDNPLHPYTMGIQKAKPSFSADKKSGHEQQDLYSIPGSVPNPINLPDTCFFKDRCDKCKECCAGGYPREIKVSETHSVFCHLYEDAE